MILSRTAQTDAAREQLLDRTEAIDWGLDAVNLTLVDSSTGRFARGQFNRSQFTHFSVLHI